MTKRDLVLVVASTRDHLARLLKYYPRRPCAPRDFFRILQIYLQYLLLSYIFKFLICIHAGNPRVPPRVLACVLLVVSTLREAIKLKTENLKHLIFEKISS